MFQAPESPYLVPLGGTFRIADAPTAPPAGAPGKKDSKEELEKRVEELEELQRRLYTANSWSVLLVFQAMDAAGKDGTIRAVLSGVDPAGFQVSSFKAPSAEELDHDFLWRTARRLPERGRIGVFNRSHYEEVLVVRVHPEFLEPQRLPFRPEGDELWRRRFASIRDHEEHLAQNGTAVLKFFLHVSRDEQRKRFLARIDDPKKNWKFAIEDVREAEHWDAYMSAYQEALAATARPWAPWYAIPADDKPYMRLKVAEILVAALESLDLRYPRAEEEQLREMAAIRDHLAAGRPAGDGAA
ncbi:MAG: PPK2 family polyphosphate kinase [Thermoanaerobaculia bacterium]